MKRSEILQLERRRYISLSIEELFSKLNQDNIRYVVLRWFETLPFIEPGEDIDLLVHDEDLDKLDPYFVASPENNTIPCDIYSLSGIPGSDFEGMPYYPKHLAASILENRVLYKDIYYVPNPRDHFFSMAYHVVYHKEARSGLPKSKGRKPQYTKPEHNYRQVLKGLALAAGLDVKMTWEELNLFLISHHWCPTTQMFQQLSRRRKWIRTLLVSALEPLCGGDLISFILRDWGYKKGLLNFTTNWLESFGFILLSVQILNESQKKVASKKLRGGNWEKGSWVKNGGGPAVLIVAYDPHPTQVPEKWKNRYPLASNGRFLLKKRLRKVLDKQLKQSDRANMIHSSDNPIEAMEYLKVICPNKISEIIQLLKEIQEKYETKEKVIQMLHGRNGIGPFNNFDHARGKTELIEVAGSLRIKKTFKPGRERFLERELFAYQKLSQKCTMIPPLLDHGDYFVMIPYYEKLTATKALFKKHKNDIRSFLEFLYQEGYAHLDFLPRNILFTKEGLKIVDFEFLYQYKEKPSSFTQSYDLQSVPKGFNGDLPPIGIHKKGLKAYNQAWKKECGYTLSELINL